MRRIRRLRWAPLVLRAAAVGLRYRRRPTGDLRGLLPPVGPVSAGRPPSGVIAKAVELGCPRSTCLVRSLTLAHLLRRHGYAAEVAVGIGPDGTETRRFAHAWVEVGHGSAPDGHIEILRLAP